LKKLAAEAVSAFQPEGGDDPDRNKHQQSRDQENGICL